MLFEGSNPLRYLWYMLGVGLKQRADACAACTRFAPGQIELTGDVHLQIDGEYAGRLPARFEIVPDALTLLMPSRTNNGKPWITSRIRWSD